MAKKYKKITLDRYIPKDVCEELYKRTDKVEACAAALSVGWNEWNINDYEKAKKDFFDYTYYILKRYDYVVMLKSRRLDNKKAGKYCYYYDIPLRDKNSISKKTLINI